MGGNREAEMSTDEFQQAQSRLLERVGVTAESRFVEVPAIAGRAHVLVSGEGSPLVLLSGVGNSGAFWAPLLAALDGFTLYAVDPPGVGLSDPIGQTPGPRAGAVEFVEQLLDGLGLRQPALMGNSLGSLWAIWLALDRPERVGPTVHVGCPALIPRTSAPLPMRLMSVPPLGRVLARLTPPSRRNAERFAALVGEDLTRSPEVADLMVATQRLPGGQHGMIETLHALLRFRGPRPEVALTEKDLQRVEAPTLLVWGGHDPFGPVEAGRHAVAAMPHARFELIDEAGHAPWLAHPKRVADLAARFLRAASP
jgi:pimeloyl-ACP methyl ester carboxylesterase